MENELKGSTFSNVTLAGLSGLATALAGCAQKAENVSAAYISPLAYSDLDCSQLAADASRLNARIAEVTGQQNKAANSDAALTAATIVIFWPAAFWLGRGDKSPELARLKGETEALQSAAIAKGCGVTKVTTTP